jgi:tRNA pseudouridine55 synthase
MIPSGLLLLHKQPGCTSFDTLRDIKRILDTGKVGHTGTLDKFAEGLLLALTGRALKLSRWFTHCDKQYEGTICFGAETDTLDPEGEIIARAPLPSREAVEQAFSPFRGKIEQAPPAYSAIHINGERASALARRGEAPEMKKRPVEIYRLELLSWEPPHARIFVHCSSGTYIRSLARDIALAAGSRAYLTALVRTQVAGFRLEEAVKIGDRKTGFEISGCSKPIDKTVFQALGLPCLEVTSDNAQKVIRGRPLANILQNSPSLLKEANTAAALFSGDTFIAMIEQQNGKWSYGYVNAGN